MSHGLQSQGLQESPGQLRTLHVEKGREVVGPEGNCPGHPASVKHPLGNRARKKNFRRTSRHLGAFCLSVALLHGIVRYELD